MAVGYNPKIVTNGLVLALDAANIRSYPGSGTTWTDLSGNGNNGTLTNGPTYNSDNKGSIVFDGVDDYVTLGTKSIITTDFCVDMWCRVTTATKEVYFFSFGYVDSTSALLYRNEGSPYDLNVIYRVSNTNTSYLSNFPINQNTFYNICWNRNGSTNTLYVNGISIYSFSNSTNLTSCIYDIGSATTRNKSTAYYQGNIYTTKLYNRALTAAEISQNFNATRSRYGI
jgi:hypothetical protein